MEAWALTIKVGLDELLEPSGGRRQRREPRPGTIVTCFEETGLEISLVGRTVEEAESVIDREIDQALLRGRDKLTIIHGLGTGRLKRGIQAHLKRHPMVKSFFSPDNVHGGAGITEVELG